MTTPATSAVEGLCSGPALDKTGFFEGWRVGREVGRVVGLWKSAIEAAMLV